MWSECRRSIISNPYSVGWITSSRWICPAYFCVRTKKIIKSYFFFILLHSIETYQCRISWTKSNDRTYKTVLQCRRLFRNKLYIKFVYTASHSRMVDKWGASEYRKYYKIWYDNRSYIETTYFHFRIKTAINKRTFLSRETKSK